GFYERPFFVQTGWQNPWRHILKRSEDGRDSSNQNGNLGPRNQKGIIMLDLHKYLTNPFNDSRISMSELLAFSNDHLARLIANNPAAVFAARIAATTTALNGVGGAFTDDKTKLALRKSKKLAKEKFRAALPAAIGKIYGAVQAQFGEGGTQM